MREKILYTTISLLVLHLALVCCEYSSRADNGDSMPAHRVVASDDKSKETREGPALLPFQSEMCHKDSHSGEIVALAELDRHLLSDDFAKVAVLRQLKYLSANGTQLDDKGLIFLAKLSQLQCLDISDTLISDEGLSSLSDLQSLECLMLSGSSVTGSGFPAIESLSRLKSLYVARTMVTDEALKNLRSASLEILDCSQTALSDVGLANLSEMPRLRDVDFHGLAITGKGLKDLRVLKTLRSLNLAETMVDDDALHQLIAVKTASGSNNQGCNLKRLNLSGTRVTNAGVKHLKNLGGLEYLDLSDTAINDEVIDELKSLCRLQELCLDRTLISQTGIQRLQRALPNARLFWSGNDIFVHNKCGILMVESKVDSTCNAHIRVRLDRASWRVWEHMGSLYRYLGDNPSLTVDVQFDPQTHEQRVNVQFEDCPEHNVLEIRKEEMNGLPVTHVVYHRLLQQADLNYETGKLTDGEKTEAFVNSVMVFVGLHKLSKKGIVINPADPFPAPPKSGDFAKEATKREKDCWKTTHEVFFQRVPIFRGPDECVGLSTCDKS